MKALPSLLNGHIEIDPLEGLREAMQEYRERSRTLLQRAEKLAAAFSRRNSIRKRVAAETR